MLEHKKVKYQVVLKSIDPRRNEPHGNQDTYGICVPKMVQLQQI